jgi:DNA helicase-2/ATP-dependent DNA helicase PcrA|tara:strand:- start:2345 stop:3865 length:1521 start_codon:yes stop_codon:yes gene_type:complete
MQCETILGPPGTGKTQTNSNRIRDCIEEGIDPDKIACVSFTRKAVKESRDRVVSDWNIDEGDMPFFQTLHAMAYRSGGYSSSDVMGSADLKKVGNDTGILFGSGVSGVESDFDTLGATKGDSYMGMYHLARSKMIPLEEAYRRQGNHKLNYTEMKHLVRAYENYKTAHHKIDFTDMIENFVRSDHCPDIEALFVDEAQDLSTLQWSMIDVLRRNPRIQVFTGDDDQAIMSFQGADVGAFLSATEKKTVLSQSYRVPGSVWATAQGIVTQVANRAPKKWSPRDEEGSVRYHNVLHDIPLGEGDWCLMARTNRIASYYAEELRSEGWVYSRKGSPSIDLKTYEAIMDWESWCKGGYLQRGKIRNIYSFMITGKGFKKGHGPRSSAFATLDKEVHNMDYATENMGLLIDGSVRWHVALGKIDLDTKNYVLNALRRGDNVKSPRIKVSTIHSMKGGESDNVIIAPDLSYAAHKEYRHDPDTEHRVFYVAATRAKKALHILNPQTYRYYDL